MLTDYCKKYIKYAIGDHGLKALLEDGLHSEEEMEYAKSYAKSKEKEYTMDKYLVIVEDGFAIGCTELKDAKDECQKAIEAGVEEVFIYERKLVASQVKPKVEFKEV